MLTRSRKRNEGNMAIFDLNEAKDEIKKNHRIFFSIDSRFPIFPDINE